ncbi:MAG: Hsp20/alpha crystallin family protein [bacterium]|nr:MAG: Hsp20/alpha crystallin family protein [bacterium]
MAEIEKTVPEVAEGAAARGESTREGELYAMPPVDIFEKEDALYVLADLPGVKPDGLAVNVENGVLTIEGKVEREEKAGYLRREFALTSFYRQFRIAETIDTERIKAALKNGVLHLTLPKIERAKARRIPIET